MPVYVHVCEVHPEYRHLVLRRTGTDPELIMLCGRIVPSRAGAGVTIRDLRRAGLSCPECVGRAAGIVAVVAGDDRVTSCLMGV